MGHRPVRAKSSRSASQTCWAGAGLGYHRRPFPYSAGATPGFLGESPGAGGADTGAGAQAGAAPEGRRSLAPARQDLFPYLRPHAAPAHAPLARLFLSAAPPPGLGPDSSIAEKRSLPCRLRQPPPCCSSHGSLDVC